MSYEGIQETMSKTKAYSETISPIYLKDLSAYSGVVIPSKMEPSCLAIF